MTREDLAARFGAAILGHADGAPPVVDLRPDALPEVARYLKDAGFDSLMCLSGLDTKGLKAAPGLPPADRILVVYHLCATTTGEKIALRVTLDRDAPRVPSVSGVWGVADWHEREAFDMYGVVFDGHPALTRILCTDDWVGHPLRKDYVPPASYGGAAHRRLPSGGALLDQEEKEARRAP